MRAFADHFSRLAGGYAAYRPHYPDGLFAAITGAAPARDVVWDCATGSGQAAEGLARHFDVVFASDASREQVSASTPNDRVRYFVARGEAVPLPARSVSAVTVAQGLHWLELPEFYAEARRVLRPGGILAAWTYGNFEVDGGRVDAALADFYDRVIGRYWAPERRWVESGYRTLRFPFVEVPIVSPPMVVFWTLDQVLGYVGTWSAVARCREVTGHDPVPELGERLRSAWGDPATARRVEWPLAVRAGR
jgi:SAM-dependent methyltransferase